MYGQEFQTLHLMGFQAVWALHVNQDGYDLLHQGTVDIRIYKWWYALKPSMIYITSSGLWRDSHETEGPRPHRSRSIRCTKSYRPQPYRMRISPWCGHDNIRLPPVCRRCPAPWPWHPSPRDAPPVMEIKLSWGFPAGWDALTWTSRPSSS